MSGVCKVFSDSITQLFPFLHSPSRIGVPLQDLAPLTNTSTLQLLFWLGNSGEKAYMLGSTAPSSFDSSVGRVDIVGLYRGDPADWDLFDPDLKNRLERECPSIADDFSLAVAETLAGTDAFGANDPDAADHAALTAGQRTKDQAAHKRLNRILASYIIGLQLDENLKSMIRDSYPNNGYQASSFFARTATASPTMSPFATWTRSWLPGSS